MSIQKPFTDTTLWPNVERHRVWPDIDETALFAHAEALKASAAPLTEAPVDTGMALRDELRAAWPDEAGNQASIGLTKAVWGATGPDHNYAFNDVGNAIHSLANSCFYTVFYVERVKRRIHDLIDDNRAAYKDANADDQAKIVTGIVEEVTVLLDAYSTAIMRDNRPSNTR